MKNVLLLASAVIFACSSTVLPGDNQLATFENHSVRSRPVTQRANKAEWASRMFKILSAVLPSPEDDPTQEFIDDCQMNLCAFPIYLTIISAEEVVYLVSFLNRKLLERYGPVMYVTLLPIRGNADKVLLCNLSICLYEYDDSVESISDFDLVVSRMNKKSVLFFLSKLVERSTKSKTNAGTALWYADSRPVRVMFEENIELFGDFLDVEYDLTMLAQKYNLPRQFEQVEQREEGALGRMAGYLKRNYCTFFMLFLLFFFTFLMSRPY